MQRVKVTFRPRGRRGLTAAIVAGGLLLAAPAAASATTYYVNNAGGSGCSNAGAGTSTGTPWCDFTNVNSHTFAAGDQILLARGDTFTSGMTPSGSGASGNPVTIDAYGSGNRPRIQLSDSLNDTAITLTNADHWAVRNLDISHATVGIGANYTTLNHTDLTFEDIYLHDFQSSIFGQGSTPPTNWPSIHYPTGIHVSGAGATDPPSGQSAVSTIRMNRIETQSVSDGIDVGCGFSDTTHNSHCIQDVVIRNSDIHYSDACSLFQNVTGLTILDSRFFQNGRRYQSVGTTGAWFWRTANVYLANDRFSQTPTSSSGASTPPDLTGLDLEAYNANTYLRGDLIDDNAGAGIEILQLGRSGDYSTNSDLRDVTFISNGQAPSNSQSSLFRIGSGATGLLQDILYYEPTGFTAGDVSGFTIGSNTSVSSEANLYNSIAGFSGVQGANGWSYESFDGSAYASLGYDSSSERWGSASQYADQFDLQPSATANAWVTKTWTAPQAGTIDIRGRVLKNDVAGGDGTRARITKNGSVIWPAGGGGYQGVAAGDLSGYDTEVSSLSVAAGDKIRFEVNDGGATSNAHDLTSWAPAVAYSSASGTVTRTDDRTTGTGVGQWSYSGAGWGSCTSCTGPNPPRYGDSVSWSSNANDTATFRFTGRQVALYAEVRSSHGIGAASICDSAGANCGAEVPFDLYRSADKGQQLVYRSPTLASGTYTLKVRVTGTRSPASSDNVVTIDAADVTS